MVNHLSGNTPGNYGYHPIILCGGAGTRLWPLSRLHYPKQLLRLTSKNSLLQDTVLRTACSPYMPPILICNSDYRFTIAEQLREIAVTPSRIMLEPVGRNTAPAVAIAALDVMARHGDGMLVIMPSDHVVTNVDNFLVAAKQATDIASVGALVTFGIEVKAPETGYGYIQRGKELATYSNSFQIDRFIEKPDVKTATELALDDRYTWNSGIFVFRAATYINELQHHNPEILDACRQAYEAGSPDIDFFRIDEKSFSESPSVSIDYAVMEKTDKAVVIPLDMGWSDVGSWESLYDVEKRSGEQNVEHGDVITIDTTGSYIRSDAPLVATVGVSDLIIVATGDAVVVCNKSRTQDIKKVVRELETQGRTEHLDHPRVYRPWGYYQTVDNGDQFQVKRISVNPGAKLSLQQHKHRAEHWVVVRGVATVTRGTETMTLEKNQSTYIPAGTRHRLENSTDSALEIIEVQSGDYLGEDDIVRFEDTYGRSD
jgi:mannose-1-phosphate guanylyltransferase / mannose-6-phosphate isomerase